MPATPHISNLAEKRYVTVILRLVVDSRGRLEYGEIVNLEAETQGRFVGWRGLIRAVRAWLAGEGHDDTPGFAQGRPV